MLPFILGIFLVFSVTSPIGPTPVWVDMIEVNHVYPRGNYAFTQVIFWKEHHSGLNSKTFHSYGFVMVKPEKLDSMPSHKAGGICEFRHTWGGQAFLVRSKIFRESWSNDDPESLDRMNFWKGSSPNLFEPLPTEITYPEGTITVWGR